MVVVLFAGSGDGQEPPSRVDIAFNENDKEEMVLSKNMTGHGEGFIQWLVEKEREIRRPAGMIGIWVMSHNHSKPHLTYRLW